MGSESGTDEAHLCPLVSGRAFTGLKNGSSPAWMANRLTAIGQRPISALVDITNYVMVDLGRPLHAYDIDKIDGGKLIIGRAKPGQTMTALNEKTYDLDEDMLVIGDANGPDDLAGIMGGERSGVSDATDKMFLEIAIFDQIAVATTGRKLNIHSDARYRFERGLDVTSPDWVQGYVARLVTSICGGEASHVTTAGEGAQWQREITLDADKVKRLTGMDVPAADQVVILESLGFTVAAGDGEWTVSPPPWRGDIDGAADLVEEIGRIHGYEHLPMDHLPREHVVAQPSLNPAQARQFRLRRALASRGLMEAVTFSFLSGPQAAAFGGGAANLTLVNPISADLSVMRPSICRIFWPRLPAIRIAARQMSICLRLVRSFWVTRRMTSARPVAVSATAQPPSVNGMVTSARSMCLTQRPTPRLRWRHWVFVLPVCRC
jgi:phenylalanyl-tRNA synthetase beta chain